MAVKLPDNYDAWDMELKKLLHPLADDKNFISNFRKKPFLACGAVRKGKTCNLTAGMGTNHLGYGRCKFHGGASTGPTTEEGKRVCSKNGKIHGLYASVLQENEREIFNSLADDKVKGLEFEINMMKSKILGYLQQQQNKFADYKATYGEEEAYRRMKVYYNESDSGARNYYHAGTVEDRPLDRALNTLARLVEKHNKILGNDAPDDLITQINSELKAASQGQISLSWGGKPQTRANKSKVENPSNTEQSEV